MSTKVPVIISPLLVNMHLTLVKNNDLSANVHFLPITSQLTHSKLVKEFFIKLRLRHNDLLFDYKAFLIIRLLLFFAMDLLSSHVIVSLDLNNNSVSKLTGLMVKITKLRSQ